MTKPVAVESAIADLKAQFEKAVAPWQKRGDTTEPVHVELADEGRWLFFLHTYRSVVCKLEPPRSLWLADKRISTEADLCFVATTHTGEKSLLVFVEIKHAAASGTPQLDLVSLPEFTKPSDVFADGVRNVAAKRSWRALHRVLSNAAVHDVEEAASQNTDLAVLVRALEQPEAIETLSEDDPFAAARLRGVLERERLLSEEGGTWTTEQVAKHLQLTRQTVNLRRKQGTLLGLDAGRHGFRYPAWQFTRNGSIKGLEQALAALQHLDPWMQQAFMLGKNARLGDKRPLDLLRAHDIASVVSAASAFGEHGAA
jgi:hypothetical protein